MITMMAPATTTRLRIFGEREIFICTVYTHHNRLGIKKHPIIPGCSGSALRLFCLVPPIKQFVDCLEYRLPESAENPRIFR